MYKFKQNNRTSLSSVETFEGERIEQKIQRITNNGEAITDGAPEIYTERKEGVKPAYNIRTDRFEIAIDAMDAVSKSIEAKRDFKPEMKVIKSAENEEKKDGRAESIQSTAE